MCTVVSQLIMLPNGLVVVGGWAVWATRSVVQGGGQRYLFVPRRHCPPPFNSVLTGHSHQGTSPKGPSARVKKSFPLGTNRLSRTS